MLERWRGRKDPADPIDPSNNADTAPDPDSDHKTEDQQERARNAERFGQICSRLLALVDSNSFRQAGTQVEPGFVSCKYIVGEEENSIFVRRDDQGGVTEINVSRHSQRDRKRLGELSFGWTKQGVQSVKLQGQKMIEGLPGASLTRAVRFSPGEIVQETMLDSKTEPQMRQNDAGRMSVSEPNNVRVFFVESDINSDLPPGQTKIVQISGRMGEPRGYSVTPDRQLQERGMSKTVPAKAHMLEGWTTTLGIAQNTLITTNGESALMIPVDFGHQCLDTLDARVTALEEHFTERQTTPKLTG